MPALDAQQDRLAAAHTVAFGASVDSTYTHAAWAEQLGGISMPLLSDFHPKGAVAASFGLYLDAAGITDRATVLIDASGVVRHISSVSPSGQRDIDALVRMAEELDAAYDDALPDADPDASVPGLPDDAVLYVKDRCMFSRWARYAHQNLHLDCPVRNVSQDDDARAELERVGGKTQAPALVADGQAMYESKDIIRYLVERAARPL